MTFIQKYVPWLKLLNMNYMKRDWKEKSVLLPFVTIIAFRSRSEG